MATRRHGSCFAVSYRWLFENLTWCYAVHACNATDQVPGYAGMLWSCCLSHARDRTWLQYAKAGIEMALRVQEASAELCPSSATTVRSVLRNVMSVALNFGRMFVTARSKVPLVLHRHSVYGTSNASTQHVYRLV